MATEAIAYNLYLNEALFATLFISYLSNMRVFKVTLFLTCTSVAVSLSPTVIS